jgi:hypothetical protein
MGYKVLMLKREIDTASLQFQRSMNATEARSFYVQQLKKKTGSQCTPYYNQYDREDGWSECAFHLAAEKGFIHNCVDRFDILRMLFIKVSCSLSLSFQAFNLALT